MVKVKFVDLGAQYESLRDEILAKFDEISRQGAYVLTPELENFEKKFAEYCGVKHAIGVANGSDALIMGLEMLGIGEGDEVITAPNSFIASAWTIARSGAKLVFADVADNMNIDPAEIEKAITPRTKAIMPVHLTGRPAPMDEILAIAEKHGLLVIEDAAQSVGAKYKGRRTGSLGICAGFSLHPLKNLHVHGDGGMITTNDDELAEKLRKHRNHGLRNREECEFWGINSRLDAIQAAIGSIKLPHLDKWNSRYREIAAYYTKNLAEDALVPTHEDYEEPVYHRYIIRHPSRDQLKAFLADKGIQTSINYPIPLHLQEAAADLGYQKGSFPKAEAQAGMILSIPIYPELTDDQAKLVVESIQEFNQLNPNPELKPLLEAASA